LEYVSFWKGLGPIFDAGILYTG